MRIVWDDHKRLANIDKHDGVDLAEVTEEDLNEAKLPGQVRSRRGRRTA